MIVVVCQCQPVFMGVGRRRAPRDRSSGRSRTSPAADGAAPPRPPATDPGPVPGRGVGEARRGPFRFERSDSTGAPRVRRDAVAHPSGPSRLLNVIHP